MSEHQVHHEKHEQFVAKEETEPRREAAPEHQPRHEKQLPSVEKLSHHAKEQAVSHELPGHEKAHVPKSDLYVSKELKSQTWNRGITRIRKQLPATSRAFSKVIHQPVVDTVSRASEKTIARPSGLLMGAVFAFLGSSAFLWIARHYGFTYNFFMFVIFFALGFAVGLMLEAVLMAFRKPKG